MGALYLQEMERTRMTTKERTTGHFTEHELAQVLKRDCGELRGLVERLVWNVKHARRIASDRSKELQQRQDTAELLDKRLPSDPFAEATVLGTLIITPDLMTKHYLTPAHFLHEGNEQVFQAMLRLKERGEPIDMLHLVEEFKKSERWSLVDEAPRLAELMEAKTIRERFPEYVERVDSMFRRRELFFQAVELIKRVHSDRTTEELEDWARGAFV